MSLAWCNVVSPSRLVFPLLSMVISMQSSQYKVLAWQDKDWENEERGPGSNYFQSGHCWPHICPQAPADGPLIWLLEPFAGGPGGAGAPWLSGGTGGKGQEQAIWARCYLGGQTAPNIGVLNKIGCKLILTVPMLSFNLTRKYNLLNQMN